MLNQQRSFLDDLVLEPDCIALLSQRITEVAFHEAKLLSAFVFFCPDQLLPYAGRADPGSIDQGTVWIAVGLGG